MKQLGFCCAFEKDYENVFLFPWSIKRNTFCPEKLYKRIMPGDKKYYTPMGCYWALITIQIVYTQKNHSLHFMRPNEPSIHIQNSENI